MLDRHYDAIQPYMTEEGREEIRRQGKYVYDREFGWVTPTINGSICAYGNRDAQGIIKCGIEAAYYDGKLDWKKPISCHLYPIKVSGTKKYVQVNYEPREVLCRPGCALGKKLKMPVYQFLKEALIRRFGSGFYEALEQAAVSYFDEKKKISQ